MLFERYRKKSSGDLDTSKYEDRKVDKEWVRFCARDSSFPFTVALLALDIPLFLALSLSTHQAERDSAVYLSLDP